MEKRNNRTLHAAEIAVFCEQISLILGANIPLYEGIEALECDYAGTPGEAAFRAMDAEMKASGSLAAAVEAAGAFPAYMTGMVRVGEEAGELDAVMRGLAAHYQREAQIRTSAVSAVRYPLTLMAVMSLVITVLVFRVVPIFEQAFMSLTGGIAGPSAAMMRVGQAAGVAVFTVMALLLCAAVALWLLLRNGKRPALTRKLLTCTPALAKLHRQMTAQRLASVLSMLLSGGFPLAQALELLVQVYESDEERKLMQALSDKVFEGETVSAALEETGLFDPLHMRMIRVGFTSGQADAALSKVAQLLAQDVDDAMARMIALIEPLLVIVLSAMIGAILLSVMMPLAGVLGAMV